VADLLAMHMNKMGYVTYESINPLGEKSFDEMGFTLDDLDLLSKELPPKIDKVIASF